MAESSKYDFLANLIKDEIDKYDKKIDTSDVGTVISVGDGIATVYGLDKALGMNVLTAVKPGQMMVKIVHDELAELMGGSLDEIGLKAS